MKLKSEIRNPKSETSFKYFNFRNFKFVSNFVLCVSCLLVLTAPLTIFVQGFVPLAEIPGLTSGVTADTAGLAKFFNNLYRFTIGMAAVLAVIMIIWGGLEISTQDSVSKKSDGKQRIYNAIFGLMLVLSPVLIFSIINPNILNLSLNLPKIDLTTAPIQTTPPTREPCRPGSLATANCTVNPVQEGLYPTPQTGGWCYQTTDGYVCSSQDGCGKLLEDDAKKVSGASCVLTP